MPNAVGYLADYLNGLAGTEATEVAAAITARVALSTVAYGLGAQSGFGVPTYRAVDGALGAQAASPGAAVQVVRTASRLLATAKGGALYVRKSLVTITALGLPAAAYFRLSDQLMPDGSTDVTNGGYVMIMPGQRLDAYQFGAFGDGSTADDAAIEALLATVSLFGGGGAYIDAGIYLTTSTKLVPSNVHVQGAGRGATIIRPQAGALTGKIVNGLSVYSSLAMVGVSKASIRGITFDHKTNVTLANGPSAIISGPTGTGANTPATNCVIEDNEVLFSAASQYMIWNHQSNGTKILNNFLDGGRTTSASGQEGIECFGGNDVLIQGNTIKDIGGNGVYLATEPGYAGNSNIRVLDNYIDRVRVGVRIAVAVDSTHLQVRGNQIKSTWLHGIHPSVASTNTLDTLDISGNDIVGAPNPIYAEAETGGFTKAVRIADNKLNGGTGSYGAGLYVARFQDITLDGNEVRNTVGFGISLEACSNLVIGDNRVDTCGRHGILLNDCVTGPVRDNILLNYNGLNAECIGVAVAGACSEIAVTGNSFLPAYQDYAVYVTSATSNRCVIRDNRLLYSPTFASGQPYRNDGTNKNTGAITILDGATSGTVTNTLANLGSLIDVQPNTGYPPPYKVVKANGSFQIVLESAETGGGVIFDWVIR